MVQRAWDPTVSGAADDLALEPDDVRDGREQDEQHQRILRPPPA